MFQSSRLYPTPRGGLTFIELVVAVAVVGLLVALLLPALLMARETSRKSTCAGNLHQLGVALANAEQQYRYFPLHSPGQRWSLRPLLRFIEQSALYEQLTNGRPPDGLPGVDLFLCPSDPDIALDAGDVSYTYNDGTLFRDAGEPNGFIRSYGRETTALDISDGLSQTAAMSERMVATKRYNDRERVPESVLIRETGRYLWYTERRIATPGEERAAADLCRADIVTPVPFYFGPTANGYQPNTGYDHLLSPNQRACYNEPPGLRANLMFNAMLIPPSSRHSGGVNLLLADGRVTFVSESIGDPVWRALGTRAGGETETLR